MVTHEERTKVPNVRFMTIVSFKSVKRFSVVMTKKAASATTMPMLNVQAQTKTVLSFSSRALQSVVREPPELPRHLRSRNSFS